MIADAGKNVKRAQHHKQRADHDAERRAAEHEHLDQRQNNERDPHADVGFGGGQSANLRVERTARLKAEKDGTNAGDNEYGVQNVLNRLDHGKIYSSFFTIGLMALKNAGDDHRGDDHRLGLGIGALNPG